MKKFTKVISLALVLVMALAVLASCGTKLSGTYSLTVAGITTSYKFSGSKVTLTVKQTLLGESEETFKGTYKITKDDDGNQIIEFTFKDKDGKDSEKYSTKSAFSQNKDDKTITIGVVTYKKG